jgi:hypothetical protein
MAYDEAAKIPGIPTDLREKLKYQAEQMQAGAPTPYGLASDGGGYSPRLALLAKIDDELDEHVRKMAELRDVRRIVTYQPEHVCDIISKLSKLRG